MRLFIKKVCLFSLPLLLVYAAVISMVFFTGGNQCLKVDMPENITTVIMGDSHTECALNDSLLPNTINLSKSSESYFFTYSKLKYFFKEQPQIKTVVLGFSYHNTAAYIDDFTYGDKSSVIISRYYPLLSIKDKLILLTKNPDIVADKQVLLTGLKYFYDCSQYASLSFLGEYLNVATEKTLNIDNVKGRINSQFYKHQNEVGLASFNLKYLDLIVELCAANDKKLILVSTPLHNLYKHEIPEKFILQYNKVIEKYNTHVIVANMDGDIGETEKYYLPDGDHVTIDGAAKTTMRFKNNYSWAFE